jgi:hypothetical protein
MHGSRAAILGGYGCRLTPPSPIIMRDIGLGCTGQPVYDETEIPARVCGVACGGRRASIQRHDKKHHLSE